MRVQSWNVNGLRAVEKKGFLKFLAFDSPDVLCIQETKAHPAQLGGALKEPLADSGKPYFSFFSSAKKRGYAGTAIYSKKKPDNVSVLGVPEFDDEGRLLQADFGNLAVVSAYFPNSQGEGLRLDYKLAFCNAVLSLCKKIIASGRHIVLAGDYNIAHKPIDLSHPKENEHNAGYLPEERAWMDKWTSSGFTDTFRHFYPEKREAYSWWSYRMHARERNVGWRLDYHCVDDALLPKVKRSVIRQEVTGSDHCPVEIELDV